MSRLILIKKISEEFSISESVASEYLKNIFETIINTLASGKNVNIADFGKFILKNNKVFFSPSRRFAEEVNYNFAGLETIKIRSFGEKEFQEKLTQIKRELENLEIELVGSEKEEATEYLDVPMPA